MTVVFLLYTTQKKLKAFNFLIFLPMILNPCTTKVNQDLYNPYKGANAAKGFFLWQLYFLYIQLKKVKNLLLYNLSTYDFKSLHNKSQTRFV